MMSTTILIILILLVIKHFLADYVFQTKKMLREKGIYGAVGGFHHSFIHAVLTFAIVTSLVGFIAGAFAFLLDFFIHYNLDWVNLHYAKHLTHEDKTYWMWYGGDQGLHYLTYIGIAYVVG